MYPVIKWRAVGSTIAAVFVTGIILGNITSERDMVNLLKPIFGNTRVKCSNMTTPSVSPDDDKWQPISRTGNKAFVYSAFLDNGVVSLVGIKDRASLQVTCQLWYWNDNNGTAYMLISSARMVRIPGGDQLPFIAWYFQCAVHHKQSPFAVSIVAGSDVCASPNNVFHVYQAMPDKKKWLNFTICVPPLQGIYPTAQRLIEWIEINRLLGVQFFTFYNDSIYDGVGNIFRKYETQGVLEILRWNHPEVDIPYHAQIASMHDCLNRNKLRRSKYTSFLDLDEMIIPHRPDDFTWEDMLNKLTFACSYSFKCSFFSENYTLAGVSNGTDFSVNRSYVLNNLKRSEKIFQHRERSKMITRPKEVHFMGTHLTYECTRGQKPRDVDANVGMLHHYRNQGGNHIIRDDTTLKYKSLLEERLGQVYALLQEYAKTK